MLGSAVSHLRLAVGKSAVSVSQSASEGSLSAGVISSSSITCLLRRYASLITTRCSSSSSSSSSMKGINEDQLERHDELVAEDDMEFNDDLYDDNGYYIPQPATRPQWTQPSIPAEDILPTSVSNGIEAWVWHFTTAERVGMVKLNERIFGAPPRYDLIHRVVTWQLARRRAGNASTKNRSQVNKSSRKPWAQKGTGRARHGSRSSPLFVGGGRAHGPKSKNWTIGLAAPVRRFGLRAILSIRMAQGDLTIVDSLELPTYRTEDFVKQMHELKLDKAVFLYGGSSYKEGRNITLATRNVPYALPLPAIGCNVYDVLRHGHVCMDVAAVKELQLRLHPDYLKKKRYGLLPPEQLQ